MGRWMRRAATEHWIPGMLLCCTVLLAAGCATTPTTTEKAPVVFYPPAPDPPRIQFLTSFDDSRDFRQTQSSFARFVVGTEEKEGIQPIAKPYGVAMYDGVLLVCDSLLGIVHSYDFAHRQYSHFGHEADEGRLQKPINVVCDKNGTRYVADVQRGQIVVFDQNNKYIRAIGDPETMRPTDCALVGDDIFIVDVGDHEVKRYDLATGRKLGSFGGPGMGPGLLFKPTNIAVGPDGRLYVTDTINCRVQIFDTDGTLEDAFGMPGDEIGMFIRPKGVAVDPDGLVYVADAAFDNVQIFGPVEDHWEAYMFFGGAGLQPGNLSLPAGLTISTDGLEYFRKYVSPDFVPEYLVIVISQFGNQRVSVYAKGHARKGD